MEDFRVNMDATIVYHQPYEQFMDNGVSTTEWSQDKKSFSYVQEDQLTQNSLDVAGGHGTGNYSLSDNSLVIHESDMNFQIKNRVFTQAPQEITCTLNKTSSMVSAAANLREVGSVPRYLGRIKSCRERGGCSLKRKH